MPRLFSSIRLSRGIKPLPHRKPDFGCGPYVGGRASAPPCSPRVAQLIHAVAPLA